MKTGIDIEGDHPPVVATGKPTYPKHMTEMRRSIAAILPMSGDARYN